MFAQSKLRAGRAYRLGGDEFCVLIPTLGSAIASERDVLELRASESLAEDGEGFTIRSSCGAIVIPDETDDASEALRLADARMYEQKNARPTAGKQSMDVLVSALEARDPDLADHTSNVSRLATAVAERLGLAPDEIESIRLAAQLHDIGKIAIPDSILSKPEALNDSEWAFMKRHTIIGERITAAAPSLRGVADIIRSSHERWDGTGYPDGIAGTSIPLGARIVFACDGFDAMTSSRPYHRPMSTEGALAELRCNAGTQFDPERGRAPRAVRARPCPGAPARRSVITSRRPQASGRGIRVSPRRVSARRARLGNDTERGLGASEQVLRVRHVSC